MPPGLHYRLPWPIDQASVVDVATVRRTETPSTLALTGDESLINVQVAVHYRIADPAAYLFALSDPEGAVTDAAKGGERPGWVGESYDLISELAEHPFHAQFLYLPEGSITPPFEYQGSLYIVWVREKREAQSLTFEEAEPLIRDELTHQKHDGLAEQLFQKLIEQAQLVVYEEVLRDVFAANSSKLP